MLTSYLTTYNPEQCYGCRACEQVCPKNAISMTPNSEGFLYPVVDAMKCIDCSLCYKTCPYDNNAQKLMPLQAFALQYNDEERLISSSSGAAFPAIADYVLSQGGYVAGCIFNDRIEAVHVVTNDIVTVKKMSGSKYVQSDVQRVYSEVKHLLDIDKFVLFSGTPCQVAGLIKYLRKPYENLLTIDLICHGVPSPLLLESYINTYKGRVSQLKFRDKKLNGWCSQGSLQIETVANKTKIKKISPYSDSYYYYYYLQNSVSRMSCYECAFSATTRVADITIGDYWNVRDVLPDLNVDKGMSVVLVNTVKGQEILNAISKNIKLYETTIEDAVKGNGNLQKPCEMPEQRLYIYDKIMKYGYAQTAKQECHYQYLIPILKRLMPASLKKVLRKIVSKN